MNRGKLVIVSIVGVALVAAGFSTWYHYRGQRQSLGFWSPPTAKLLVEGPQVKAFELGASAPTPDENESSEAEPAKAPAADAPAAGEEAPDEQPAFVEFNHLDWKVLEVKDVAAAKGANNIRRALVIDTTFDWKTPPLAEPPQWEFALAVNDGRRWATVLFDFESRRVALSGGTKTALLDPSASEDFRQFFEEQFPLPPKEAEPNEAPAEMPAESAAEAKPAEPPADK